MPAVYHSSGPTDSLSVRGVTYTNSLGANVYTSRGTAVTARTWSSMSGFKIPGFNALKRSGRLLPVTPFNQIFWEGSGETNAITFRYDIPGYWNQYIYTAPLSLFDTGMVILSGGEGAEILNSLNIPYMVQAAAAQVYEQSHDVLTSLAEAPQTINMFRSLVRDLFRLYKTGIRRAIKILGNKGTRAQVLLLASRWLEGRYGWRTLIYEIESFHKAYTKTETDRNRFKRRVTNSGDTSDTWSVAFPSLTSAYYTASVDHVLSVNVTARGHYLADISLKRFSANPLITGWELVNFSFVIDWFVDVGQALSALSAEANATQSISWYGYETRASLQSTLSVVGNYPEFTTAGTCSYEQEVTLQVRELTNLSVSPIAAVRLSPLKGLDLLALMLQQMKNWKF